MAIKRQQQAEREREGRDKVQTQLKVTQKGQIVVMHPSGQKVGEGKAVAKPAKLPQASTSSGQKSTLKQSTLPVTKSKKSPGSSSSGGDSSNKPVARGEPEPIRVNVRRTLKEQLTSRIADTPEAVGKLSGDEVTKFATDVEYEMFMLFNKDTGTKYRAKYRSLMFNIKDRKNMSLLEKICGKMITASQLVRMAPEELASQELAQWRENENKHQLEMIKKSELDLLACAKNYVLKTHKGEEVIESRISDRVSLDPSIAVEDVVSVLNDTVTSSSEPGAGGSVAGKDKSQGKGEKGKDGVSSSKSHSSSSSSGSKKKDRDRRSRSRDRHDSRGKSSKHKRKRSRDRRSRSREKEERHRESKRDDRKDKRDRKNVSSSSSKKSSEQKPPQKELKPLVSEKKEDTFNLIDKILKASELIEKTPQEEEEDKKEESKEVKEEPMEKTEILPEPPKKSMSVESDQEPSSTITIPTPPETAFDTEEEFPEDKPSIWSGSINMVDVATFQIAAFSVSGECEMVGKELPPALDIVGRISPETVWEYISKIKKSGNKEILIMQFKAETESEQAKYSALYSYLDSRKRLGVVKTSSSTIKDFYISPLAAHKSLPTVLLPIKGVGFEDNRPDLLLGIIVMIKSGIKRVSTTQVSSKHSKRAALTAAKGQIPAATDNHTPPTSPNPPAVIKPKGLQESRKKLMMILPKQSSKDKAQVPETKTAAPAK
uniref:Uncharacterized protein n=1 Tax=Phlebotomus papatasi TaxID=29031 RepID=A0A1B0DQZ4_PHLPP